MHVHRTKVQLPSNEQVIAVELKKVLAPAAAGIAAGITADTASGTGEAGAVTGDKQLNTLVVSVPARLQYSVQCIVSTVYSAYCILYIVLTTVPASAHTAYCIVYIALYLHQRILHTAYCT
jgi:hypothetical protein